MNTNCLVCGSPTKSHHVATTNGEAQYLCHSCWQRRNTPGVQDALARFNVLTREVLDQLLKEYREHTTAVDVDAPLPALPLNQPIDFRRGPGGDVFELAGAELVGKKVDFDGRFAGVVPVIDLPRDPEAPVHAAVGYGRAGDGGEEAFLAWLCIGDDEDDLATALERITKVLRGGARV